MWLSRARRSPGPEAMRQGMIAALMAMVVIAGCSSREPTLEERAVALDRQLMCPVCQGQTLDESRSQLAEQMKELVREKLAAGEDEVQIKAYFADPARYGSAVLASPPATGFNLTLWAVPPALAAAGAAGVVLILRGMRRKSAPGAALPEAAGTALLGEYLSQVDRDLGLSAGSAVRAEKEPSRLPGGPPPSSG